MQRSLLWSLALLLGSTLTASAANPMVIIDTSMGTMKVELFEDKAPISVKNFLSYVDDKFYDGTIFHRVINGFMIQGGGFQPGMREKQTKAPIKNEAGNAVSNKRGTLAMARTNDPDSATAQFFINHRDNGRLDRASDPRGVGYAVFGRVVEGTDVLDKIAQVRVGDRGPHEAVPVQDVVIRSIRRVEK